MKYHQCRPIEPSICQAWCVEIGVGTQIILLVDKNFTVEGVHEMCKVHWKEFKLHRMDVGQFHVNFQGSDHSYSADSRRIDQDWNVAL